MSLVFTQAELISMTSLMTGSGYALQHAEVNLYKNNVNPNPGLKLSDYTPCTFPGYAPISITAWSLPYNSASGSVETVGGVFQFEADSTISTTEQVFGYYLSDISQTRLLAAESFPVAQTIAAPHDAVSVVVTMSLQDAS